MARLPRTDTEHPFFSIIIPTHNRSGICTVCLRSLTRLDYPRDRFQVILVDDGGACPLESTVAPFRDYLNLILLTQQRAGPAMARNTGAARSEGQFLAFIDDDCAPAVDWLRTLAFRFAATPDHIIGGRTINALLGNPYSTASQLLIDYLYAYYNVESNRACFLTSNNLALPAAGFHQMGGFDTDFPLAAGEDREFCDRWLFHGHQMSYASEAVVYHHHHLTLSGFCRQHLYYGRGAFYFHQARARRGQTGVNVEPWSFYLSLLQYPFWQARRKQALAYTMLLTVSQAANVAGFFQEKLGLVPDRMRSRVDNRDRELHNLPNSYS